VTGLTAGAQGSDLSNTTVTTTDRAKVVVADKLGNKVCSDVDVVTASTTLSGAAATFGVDKIPPAARDTTANNGAKDKTGYNVSKTFSFVINDSISSFSATTPLQGTLLRNFFTAGSGAAVDCVIGHYTASGKTCADTLITITSTFGTSPNAGVGIEFTNGSAVEGYYTIKASPVDLAGNVGNTITKIAAFDVTAPDMGVLTQAPATVATSTVIGTLSSVTVSGTATDNLDLATSKGDVVYATAPKPISGPAAAQIGPAGSVNFDATLVKTATVSATLTNLYRSLQSLDGSNVVQTNAAAPQAIIAIKDVGGNVDTSAALTIVMDSALTNILTGLSANVTWIGTPTSASPATTQASTTLTLNLAGPAADIPFQSQPFGALDIYKLDTSTNELVLVSTTTANAVSGPVQAGVRTFTWQVPGVALKAAATNTFYVVGRNALGQAVISNAIVVTNP
jgi:hypothetical protein